ncbi:hypothetical protein EGI22_19200 [Lacihabitans sp. LS3-19]|uniref:GIN domain-containing protein n=1 Tax=Lacihabitans sp. LS3-19 TaxID=2487335 RepID=UPI0020CD640A|nr:DUF2807 domain-containing protein [Lacihabitans sp. LS3-19]MCP9770035.1 hypothetical protein [Lacihabitans sp. LS3-19]
MKLSTKLLLGLLLSFMILVVINAFSVKSNLTKMDKNEQFLNYEKLSDLPFKYLKVNAPEGATGRVNILESNKSQLYVSHSWADKVIYKINNDTLFVEFLKDPEGKPYTYDQFEKLVIVTCPDLNSLETNNVSISIDSLRQDKLSLIGKGYGSFEFRKMNINDFDIDLESHASCNFYVNQFQKIRSLKASLIDTTSLNIRAINAERIEIENGPMTGLEVNGATLKLLTKQIKY